LSFSSPSWRATISGNHRDLRYIETDERIRSVSVHGLASAAITRRGRLELEARYRRESWSGTGSINDLNAHGVKLAYVWRLHQIVVELNGRLSKIEHRRQREDTSKVYLSVRREF
jgi:hypothetical protein